MKIRNILKLSGDTDTKSEINGNGSDYAAFQAIITLRFCISAVFSIAVVIALYLFLWKQRVGDWIVWVLEGLLQFEHEQAFYLYHNYFRSAKEIFFAIAILCIFLLLLRYLFYWMTRYFKEINAGIESLLEDSPERMCFSPEMQPFETKLHTVRNILKQREQAVKSAEQRKDELVMYLAHDIRTPLTSVIGYLNLLEQNPALSTQERARYTHIALTKAHRLETMINEFFEITRYNSQQITIVHKPVNLYYLLVQVIDEHIPFFAKRGNHVSFQAEEPLQINGDAEKLARVFNNLLKNAALYSRCGTEVTVCAAKVQEEITVTVSNYGETIPKDKLDMMFQKFFRLDEARATDAGGTGLGLAIAKEIVMLHGGKIFAKSQSGCTTFTVTLPTGKDM